MIISGCDDNLSCLSQDLMLNICTMLDLQSIASLSQVNRFIRKFCVSDHLWQILYKQHQGNPNTEVSSLAEDLGWREVFFMSKLHLQKEISRRRKSSTKLKT